MMLLLLGDTITVDHRSYTHCTPACGHGSTMSLTWLVVYPVYWLVYWHVYWHVHWLQYTSLSRPARAGTSTLLASRERRTTAIIKRASFPPRDVTARAHWSYVTAVTSLPPTVRGAGGWWGAPLSPCECFIARLCAVLSVILGFCLNCWRLSGCWMMFDVKTMLYVPSST